MSLTSLLRDPQSSVRMYLEGIASGLSELSQNSTSRSSSDHLGLLEISRSTLLHPRPPGVDGGLVGTAFDFRARMELGPFNARSSTAATGAAQVARYQRTLENGRHKARVLRGAFEVASELTRSNSSLDLDRASVLLAYCEQVFRVGEEALTGSLGNRLNEAIDAHDFCVRVDRDVLSDLGQLLFASQAQLVAWKDGIASGQNLEMNPAFSGEYLVDGADGDWIIGDTLVDCKVHSEISPATLRKHMIQLLGYVMLDLNDRYGIRNVAIWLPRHQVLVSWPLTRLLGGVSGELLPGLRSGFIKAASDQQVAKREAVSERRRRELLAENRHTPFEMLEELGRSDTPAIRRRVGRNSATPEGALRPLSRDRSWSVREAVALNVSTPSDVLVMLSTDRSVAVRKAVASNAGTPEEVLATLATDLRRDGGLSARSNASKTSTAVDSNRQHSSELAVTANRDAAAWNSGAFFALLDVVLNKRRFGRSNLPIPEASLIWADLDGRDARVPGWLPDPLPRQIVDDLLLSHRPRWVRWRAAQELPIDEEATRARLLADEDPEIRWDSLKRTVTVDAPDLRDLLATLAESRSTRAAFRRVGAHKADISPAACEKEMLSILASHASSSASVLSGLVGTASLNLRLILLQNEALPLADREMIIEGILRTVRVEPRAVLAGIPNLVESVVERMAHDRSPGVRSVVAARRDLSASVQAELASDSNTTVRLALVQNESIPRGLQVKIAADLLRDCLESELFEVLDVVESGLRNDDLHSAIAESLERMSKSKARDPGLRVQAAQHQLTPESVLRDLSSSADRDVREAVAGNSRTPRPLLAGLSRDGSAHVRCAVAENARTPSEVIENLSYDLDARVRSAVAERAGLPSDLLARLVDDPDDGVRRTARHHPNAGRQHASAQQLGSESAALQKSRSAKTDRQNFHHLAADTRAERRMSVAFDNSAPGDVLELLGGERRSSRVRRAVAANPNAPARLLRALADDDDEQVRHAVAFNRATPAEVLIELSKRGVDLALFVALNPDAPDAVLRELATDCEPLVAYVAGGALMELIRVSPVSALKAGRSTKDG